MRSCRECKWYKRAKQFKNPHMCAKYQEGKAGQNWGELYFDLAEECEEFLPIETQAER